MITMRIKEKKNALIVRGVVIPCGLSDKTNDKPQSKEDIKKIFTNYIAHETDVQHSWVKNFGVYPLENTLVEDETIIAGQTVPANSWIASHLVVNQDIQAMIRELDLNGYSLGAVEDAGLNENQNFLNKSLRYEYLKDSEDLNPLFISFVDKPANGFKWEVYDYDSFLAKSLDYNFGDEIMSENGQEIGTPEGYVSEGFVERLFGNLFMKKSESEEEKEEPPVDGEEKDDECKMEKAESVLSDEDIQRIAEAVAPAVVEALKELAKEETPVEPSEEDDKLEKSVKEGESSEEENDDVKMEKSETTDSNKEDKFMTKSTTKVDEPVKYVQPSTSTKRDRHGRNIKYL